MTEILLLHEGHCQPEFPLHSGFEVHLWQCGFEVHFLQCGFELRSSNGFEVHLLSLVEVHQLVSPLHERMHMCVFCVRGHVPH